MEYELFLMLQKYAEEFPEKLKDVTVADLKKYFALNDGEVK